MATNKELINSLIILLESDGYNNAHSICSDLQADESTASCYGVACSGCALNDIESAEQTVRLLKGKLLPQIEG